MAYDPKAIANYFLIVAKAQGRPLTPMQVQKLTYFAHGWHLAIEDKPLIDEQVEAWAFGPVIPSLYRDFRHYGNQPIDELAHYYLTWFPEGMTNPEASDMELRQHVPTIDEKPDKAAKLKPLLDRIWEVYGWFTGAQLSNMTHEPNSPWTRVAQQYGGAIPKGTDIPSDFIRDYFVGLAEPKPQAKVVFE